MSPRDWIFRLEDIAEAMAAISSYIAGMTYDEWLSDKKTVDAVIRNLEIIGEAAANTPDEVQKQYPEIPWNKMKTMRNFLIHEYFGVDLEIVWKTLIEDLPALNNAISTIQQRLQ